MSAESMTFADAARLEWRVAYCCAAPGQHGGQFHLTGEEGSERFGPSGTIGDVRRRLRCKCCGHRGEHIMADVWQPTPAHITRLWS